MTRVYSWSPLVFAILLSSVASAQELPDNWREAYTQADSWQEQCEAAGRGGGCREGNTYYLNAEDGLLVNVWSAAPPPTNILIIAPYQGECTGGSVAIEGAPTIELVSVNNYCVVAGGKMFRDRERITNPQSQLDLGMLRNAESIQVTVTLENGETLSATVPMQGFSEKLDSTGVPQS